MDFISPEVRIPLKLPPEARSPFGFERPTLECELEFKSQPPPYYKGPKIREQLSCRNCSNPVIGLEFEGDIWEYYLICGSDKWEKLFSVSKLPK